jgi:hypothetical protein
MATISYNKLKLTSDVQTTYDVEPETCVVDFSEETKQSQATAVLTESDLRDNMIIATMLFIIKQAPEYTQTNTLIDQLSEMCTYVTLQDACSKSTVMAIEHTSLVEVARTLFEFDPLLQQKYPVTWFYVRARLSTNPTLGLLQTDVYGYSKWCKNLTVQTYSIFLSEFFSEALTTLLGKMSNASCKFVRNPALKKYAVAVRQCTDHYDARLNSASAFFNAMRTEVAPYAEVLSTILPSKNTQEMLK